MGRCGHGYSSPKSCPNCGPMIALLKADQLAAGGRWPSCFRGAATHTGADLMSALRSDGWELRRIPQGELEGPWPRVYQGEPLEAGSPVQVLTTFEQADNAVRTKVVQKGQMLVGPLQFESDGLPTFVVAVVG